MMPIASRWRRGCGRQVGAREARFADSAASRAVASAEAVEEQHHRPAEAEAVSGGAVTLGVVGVVTDTRQWRRESTSGGCPSFDVQAHRQHKGADDEQPNHGNHKPFQQRHAPSIKKRAPPRDGAPVSRGRAAIGAAPRPVA